MLLEHVARNDEGKYQREGGSGQLPGPEVTLKEQRHKREGGGDEGADNVDAESGHRSRHETAHATQQGQECEKTGLKETGDARKETADSTRDADKEPHEKGITIGLTDCLLVFVDIHAVAG